MVSKQDVFPGIPDIPKFEVRYAFARANGIVGMASIVVQAADEAAARVRAVQVLAERSVSAKVRGVEPW